MKKQLKIMSLLLSLVLLLASATPLAVKANGSIDMDDNAQLITPSSDAIYSIRAADASAELCRSLNAMNIPTQSNTLIEVVPLSGEDGGTALVVTNMSGVTVTKDILVAPDAEEGFVDLTIVPPADASVCTSGNAYYPNYTNNLVCATVTFDYVSGFFYRPRSVRFVYTSNGSDVVTNVDVRYICQGFVYTYPGLEDLSSNGLDVYRHEIPVFKSAPVSGTSYSFSRSYSSDRIIQVPDLNPAVSHHVDFIVYVNGERRARTIPVLPPYYD